MVRIEVAPVRWPASALSRELAVGRARWTVSVGRRVVENAAMRRTTVVVEFGVAIAEQIVDRGGFDVVPSWTTSVEGE